MLLRFPDLPNNIIDMVNYRQKKPFVFDFDETNPSHIRWAVLADNDGTWGRDGWWEIQMDRAPRHKLTEHAIERTKDEIAMLGAESRDRCILVCG